MSPRPVEPLVIVGPVTWDLFDGERVPGGAVSYAARVAAAFGIRAHVLVTAGPDADLGALDGHEVQVVASPGTLTYEHQFDAHGQRTLFLREPSGRMLTPGDVPAQWPAAETLLLCPLLPDDLDAAAFVDASPASEIGLIAQGLQRRVADGGRIEALEEPSDALVAAADARVSVCLSSDETGSWSVRETDRLVSAVRRLVVTHGRSGSTIHSHDRAFHVPARLAEQADATGAGDVFATALILALRSGDGDAVEDEAGRLAAAYAAANIERHGAAPLPPLSDVQVQLAEGRPAAAAGGVPGTGESTS